MTGFVEIHGLGKGVRAFYTEKSFPFVKGEEDYSVVELFCGIKRDRFVRASQTHTSTIRTVTSAECGEGVVFPLKETDYDGMITDEKGTVLLTVEADCVPVYLYDVKKGVIGMVHSGWRGCAGEISANAVREMVRNYGTDPCDVNAVIGPHICDKCYEVGGELIDEFSRHFSENEIKKCFSPKSDGKYLLNMSEAIKITLKKCGVLNITDTETCTFCGDNLCSYRKTGDKKARMLTGIFIESSPKDKF